MKRQVGGLVLLASLAGVACQAPAPTMLTDADVTAIEAVSASFISAMQGSDWAALGATYTEDAILMPPNSLVVEGRANIEAFFEAFPAVSEFTLEDVEIAGQGDVAWVRGVYSFVMTVEDGTQVPDTGKFIEIRQKQPDGSWLLHRDIFNSDVPLP